MYLKPSSSPILPTATCATGGRKTSRHNTLLVPACELAPAGTAMPRMNGLHLGCYLPEAGTTRHTGNSTVPLPAWYLTVASLRAWRPSTAPAATAAWCLSTLWRRRTHRCPTRWDTAPGYYPQVLCTRRSQNHCLSSHCAARDQGGRARACDNSISMHCTALIRLLRACLRR